MASKRSSLSARYHDTTPSNASLLMMVTSSFSLQEPIRSSNELLSPLQNVVGPLGLNWAPDEQGDVIFRG